MQFNLLFAVITNLTFTIDFKILPDAQQDYLYFAGQNTTAHLYRENNTVFLHLQSGSEYELYQTNIKNKLEFSWQKFKINGTEMTKVKSSRNESLELTFDTFTFLSPIISTFDPQEEPIIKTILESEKINYYYILAIVLCVVLVFDVKPRVFKLLQDLITKTNDYEVMKATTV